MRAAAPRRAAELPNPQDCLATTHTLTPAPTPALALALALTQAGAQWSFRIFFLAVPAACYLLAALPAWRMAISADAHRQILKQLRARAAPPPHAAAAAAAANVEPPAGAAAHPGEAAAPPPPPSHVATDPLTGRPIRLPRHGPSGIFLRHFSNWERRRVRAQRAPLTALRRLLLLRLGGGLLLLLLLLALMASAFLAGAEMVFTTAVTLGCLGLAGVVVLLAWDGARLRATWHAPPVAWSTLEAFAERELEEASAPAGGAGGAAGTRALDPAPRL